MLRRDLRMRTSLLPFVAATSLSVAVRAQHPYDVALAAANAGLLDSAMASVQRAIVHDPADARAYKLRGDLHQRKDEVDEALDDYNRSEQLDPNNARLYISRSALRISKGMLKTALKDCEMAIELAPDDPDGYYNRACLLYLGDNVEGARKDAERAVKLDPQHADALYLAGVANGELHQDEIGLAQIADALALKPTIPGGVMSMAILLYESLRYEEAIVKFSEVLATDTNNLADAYYYRGDCYYHLKNKEKACADFSACAALKDKDAVFIRKNYCETDLGHIPKKPVRKRRRTMVEF